MGLNWDAHLDSVMETLVDAGSTEVQDLVATDRLMLWFWKAKDGEAKATMVSDDQGFQKLLNGLREDGLTMLYGKAHTEDDERSPSPN